MKNYLLAFVLCLSIGAFAETYNFARLDNTNGLSNNQIECIYKDSRGFMWFGTNFGLNRYDGYNVKVYKSIKNDSTSLIYNAISRIQEDVNGNLWIAGNPGYVVYDVHTEKFNRNISSFLSPLGIRFIPALVEIDKQKNYYFYRVNDGIYKFDVSSKKILRFQQSTDANTFSQGVIINIKSDHGFLWVLFQSGLLERLNEKTNTVDFRNYYVQKKQPGATILKNLFIDSSGSPWVYPGIGDKGILSFDINKSEWVFFGDDKKEFRSPSDMLIASNFVRDITEDGKGRIWIATDHGGVNIFDKTTNKITVLRNDPMNPNSLSQNSAISLYYDNTGIMWVGTYKNGLSYYHPGLFKFDKSPLFFYHNPDLENKDCNTLYEDRKGNLWIGTNGSGVLKWNYKTQKFQLFRNRKGDPSSISSDIIISMVEDRAGTMWFGTFLGGLNQLVGDKFKQFQSNVNNPNSLSNKSIYGLVEDRNQNLWIGTLGGGVDELDVTRSKFRRHDIGNIKGMTSNYILSLYSKDSAIVYLSTSAGIDKLNTFTNTITPIFKGVSQQNKLSDLIVYNTLIDKRNLLWIATDNGINIYNLENKSIDYINKSNGLISDQVVSLI